MTKYRFQDHENSPSSGKINVFFLFFFIKLRFYFSVCTKIKVQYVRTGRLSDSNRATGSCKQLLPDTETRTVEIKL